MRTSRLCRSVIAAGCLISVVIGCSSPVLADTPALVWPETSPQLLREDILGLRFRLKREIDGPKTGLAFLQREFDRHPTPEVTAYLGWMAMYGDSGWGYPEFKNTARAKELLTDAEKSGSITARAVLAHARGDGLLGAADPKQVADDMLATAEAGVPRSMALIGYYYAIGYGVPRNMVESERWTSRAADLGSPFGIYNIGLAYENGTISGRKDVDMAMTYYQRAALQGSDDARDRLKELAQQGVAAAELYQALAIVHRANWGFWIPPSLVKPQVAYLEEHAGDNATALLEVGVAHMDGDFTRHDYAAARDLLKRAMLHGSTAARFYFDKMRLRGWGGPAEPDALKEIQQLADMGVPDAANYIGYIHYWGTKEAGTKRDDAKAFKYVRIAAEKGHPVALMNLAFCYENGIGTPENYALAALVYWQGYLNGYTRGRDKVQRLLPFVK